MIWWVVVHVVGAVLGAGAATVNDVLFLRAIGSPEEGEAYRRYASTLSAIAWTGIILILASSAAFWVAHPGILQSQKILVKIGLTVVVAVNGALMGMILLPKVRGMERKDWTNQAKLRWTAGSGTVLGAISIVTWYTLLTLGAVGRTGWTAAQILPFYLAALVLAWLAGRFIVGRRLAQL